MLEMTSVREESMFRADILCPKGFPGSNPGPGVFFYFFILKNKKSHFDGILFIFKK